MLMVTSKTHPLASLKAYASLAGVIATAMLGTFAADSTIGLILTLAAAVATAIATYVVPNADVVPPVGAEPDEPYTDDGFDDVEADADDAPLVPGEPEFADNLYDDDEAYYEDEPEDEEDQPFEYLYSEEPEAAEYDGYEDTMVFEPDDDALISEAPPRSDLP